MPHAGAAREPNAEALVGQADVADIQSDQFPRPQSASEAQQEHDPVFGGRRTPRRRGPQEPTQGGDVHLGLGRRVLQLSSKCPEEWPDQALAIIGEALAGDLVRLPDRRSPAQDRGGLIAAMEEISDVAAYRRCRRR
jgi:hypothetical protein